MTSISRTISGISTITPTSNRRTCVIMSAKKVCLAVNAFFTVFQREIMAFPTVHVDCSRTSNSRLFNHVVPRRLSRRPRASVICPCRFSCQGSRLPNCLSCQSLVSLLSVSPQVSREDREKTSYKRRAPLLSSFELYPFASLSCLGFFCAHLQN